ncbi:MAG: hypothetical protein ACFE9R_18650 [Candidatus Hermodarchaeota archaeon]
MTFFVEDIEQISINATNRFFQYLRIQTNFNLAQSNFPVARIGIPRNTYCSPPRSFQGNFL